MITHTHRVVRWVSRTDIVDCYQVLLRDTHIFGIRIWSREIDREDIPSWASIQRACLGWTEWRSRFADYIDGTLQ